MSRVKTSSMLLLLVCVTIALGQNDSEPVPEMIESEPAPSEEGEITTTVPTSVDPNEIHIRESARGPSGAWLCFLFIYPIVIAVISLLVAGSMTRAARDRQSPAQMRRHRGGLILVLGILGIVLSFGLGLIAWLVGKSDLLEMDRQRTDPAGRGLTNAGMVCGLIGVLLGAAILAIWSAFVFLPVIMAIFN